MQSAASRTEKRQSKSSLLESRIQSAQGRCVCTMASKLPAPPCGGANARSGLPACSCQRCRRRCLGLRCRRNSAAAAPAAAVSATAATPATIAAAAASCAGAASLLQVPSQLLGIGGLGGRRPWLVEPPAVPLPTRLQAADSQVKPAKLFRTEAAGRRAGCRAVSQETKDQDAPAEAAPHPGDDLMGGHAAAPRLSDTRVDQPAGMGAARGAGSVRGSACKCGR